MTCTRLYLVRHGQVQGHGEKRYNGWGEVPLTPLGREQSARLAERLCGEPVAAVYSSDLGRCLEGARLIAARHALVPQPSPALRELNMGIWEGIAWSELQQRYPQEWQARLDDLVRYRVPQGESLLDLAARARPALQEILRRHEGQEVVVVGHGGLNRLILLDAIGAPLERLFSIEQNYACLNIIDYYEDGLSVVKLVNSVSGEP